MRYDWKITAKKFGIITTEVLIAGLLAEATDIPALLALVPFAEALRNYLKNRN